jgi:hypothetical protein
LIPTGRATKSAICKTVELADLGTRGVDCASLDELQQTGFVLGASGLEGNGDQVFGGQDAGAGSITFEERRRAAAVQNARSLSDDLPMAVASVFGSAWSTRYHWQHWQHWQH